MVKLIIIANEKEQLVNELDRIKQQLIQGYLQGYSGTLSWDFIPSTSLDEDE